jgi:hypothetical protein
VIASHVHHYAEGKSEAGAEAVLATLNGLRRITAGVMPANEAQRRVEGALEKAIREIEDVVESYANASDGAHLADRKLRDRLNDVAAIERAAARATEGGEGE